MNKNKNLTLMDSHQIERLTFDEAFDAQRVYIVGGNYPQIIEVPKIIEKIVYKEIDKPIIIKETKEFIPKWLLGILGMETLTIVYLIIKLFNK